MQTTVQNPVKIPSLDTLIQCRDGLTRQIKKTKKHIDKDRLKIIREEIDFLIEVL